MIRNSFFYISMLTNRYPEFTATRVRRAHHGALDGPYMTAHRPIAGFGIKG